MHVIVELDDGARPTFPPADGESDSLAAFLISVDVVTETGITRRSMPELLDDTQQWDAYFGKGGSLPRPDDREAQRAVRALGRWAAEYARRERRPNPLAPFRCFAFESPSTTDEGLELKESAWQESTDVALACWAVREAIRADPTLRIVDSKFPFLAWPAPLPDRPKSNLDALRDIALGASGQHLRLLLANAIVWFLVAMGWG